MGYILKGEHKGFSDMYGSGGGVGGFKKKLWRGQGGGVMVFQDFGPILTQIRLKIGDFSVGFPVQQPFSSFCPPIPPQFEVIHLPF